MYLLWFDKITHEAIYIVTPNSFCICKLVLIWTTNLFRTAIDLYFQLYCELARSRKGENQWLNIKGKIKGKINIKGNIKGKKDIWKRRRNGARNQIRPGRQSCARVGWPWTINATRFFFPVASHKYLTCVPLRATSLGDIVFALLSLL